MDQKITEMKGLVVSAGKYMALGIIFVACLPVISPLLLLFSFFGIVFFLPLVSALAGIFYFRKYAALLYRTLLELGPAYSRGVSRGRHFTGPRDHLVDTTLPPPSIKDVQANESSAEEDDDSIPVSSAAHDEHRSETGSSSGDFLDDGTVAEDESRRQHNVLERMHIKEDGETLQTSASTERVEKDLPFSIERQYRTFETFEEHCEKNPHVKHAEEDKLEGADRSNMDRIEAASHSFAEQERKDVSAAPNVEKSQEGIAEQQRQGVSPAPDVNDKGQEHLEDEREFLSVEAPIGNEECEDHAEDEHDFLSEGALNINEKGEDHLEDKHESLAEGAPNDNEKSEDLAENKHEFLSEGAPNITEEGEDYKEYNNDILSEGASNVNDDGENRTEDNNESPSEGVHQSDVGRFEADSKHTIAGEGIAEQEGQLVSPTPSYYEAGEDSKEGFHGEVVGDRQRSNSHDACTDRDVGEELRAQPEVKDEEKNASTMSATSTSGLNRRDRETVREIDPATSLLAHQAHVDDIWICKECGWKYPNAKPSAKIRRNHKKHCQGAASPVQSLGDSPSVLRSPECDARVVGMESSMSPFSPSSPGFSPQQKLEKNSSMADGASPEASFHGEREKSVGMLIADKAAGEDSPREKDSKPSVAEVESSSSELQSETKQAEYGENASSVQREGNEDRLPVESTQDGEIREEERKSEEVAYSLRTEESDLDLRAESIHDEGNEHSLVLESPKDEEIHKTLSAEISQDEKIDDRSFQVEASKDHQHDRNLPADYLQDEEKHYNSKVDSTQAEQSDRNSSPKFSQDEETEHTLPAECSEEEAFDRNLPAQSSKEEKNDHSVVTESLQDEVVDHSLVTKSSTDKENEQSLLPEPLQDETIDHNLVKKPHTDEEDDRHLPAESPQGEATLQAQTPASSKTVAFDNPPLSPASSGVYEDPTASESFRSASESFRLAPDEFFDDEASSIGDSQDGHRQFAQILQFWQEAASKSTASKTVTSTARNKIMSNRIWKAVDSQKVQEELQLQQELNTIKGIVGDQNISGGTLVMEIEELSEFLGFDLPDRRENVPELEWARLSIEVMKVVVGLE